MKYLFAVSVLCGLLVLQVLAQQTPTLPEPPAPPPEAYPGQSTHQAPPEDYFCRRQTVELDVPPDHACICERMFSPDDGHVMEDKKCQSYCWPSKCLCGIGGKPMTPK